VELSRRDGGLVAGEHEHCDPAAGFNNGYGIFWNNPSRSRMNNRFVHALYLSAEVADRIDYYFIYGPEMDQIIGRYRELTGEVPLFGQVGVWILAVQEQVRVAAGD
jgi:alpha-glucosidase (family GH31 glycosyl hydrolase)